MLAVLKWFASYDSRPATLLYISIVGVQGDGTHDLLPGHVFFGESNAPNQ